MRAKSDAQSQMRSFFIGSNCEPAKIDCESIEWGSLCIFISLTSDSSDGAVCDERGRLHGLDLSTKHVADDARCLKKKKAAEAT